VVACPCALGLATPLSMAVTIGRAAQRGILVRSPEALETSSSIQRFVFDKTGTLTRGRLTVVGISVLPHADCPEERLLQLAASVEQFSEHPLAAAIVRANQETLLSGSEFVSLRGAGASARVGQVVGERVTVGSAELVGIAPGTAQAKMADLHSSQGETVVWVALDGIPTGLIALRDMPNPTAAEALRQLHASGIETVMLSGDNPLTVQVIAKELGIDTFEGSCPPERKAEKIRAWQEKGEKVGMVGDGVNDAPALAQADLSVTAAGGSDISGQASDLVLTRSDLRLIPWYMALSKRTRATILQNLSWAFAYNLVAIPLAVTGWITPVIAAITMAVSSLLVVLNSLRLRRK
jgi:P-type Cu+ transporter